MACKEKVKAEIRAVAKEVVRERREVMRLKCRSTVELKRDDSSRVKGY
jgi:hypothetical protein